MARRSPPVVNETYETGCTWRMFRIFNFREGHSNRRLVSNSSLVNEKFPSTGDSSRRRKRDYGCKSISCVENDQVVDRGNEVTKMIVDQRFADKLTYQGKDGASCQPNQLFDALQILYSNKELFLKLLQDPNSLLVNQIHDSRCSQAKEPYQARQKQMTKLNKSQNSNTRQRVKSLKSFDRYDLSIRYKSQSSNRIVVLKPSTVNMQNIRPSRFPLCHVKRKLRHVMKVRRKEQQWRTVNVMPSRFRRGSLGLEDGKMAKELDIAWRNSPIAVYTSIAKRLSSYLYWNKRDKIKGQEAASCVESYKKNRNNTSSSPSKQNILNIHFKGWKGPSQILNRENGSYSSLGQKIKDPSVATANNTVSDKLQVFSADIATRNIPKDGRSKDRLTQNINKNNTTSESGSFLTEIQILSRSPENASANPSSCQKLEDSVNKTTRVYDHHSAESLEKQFTENDVTNSQITIFQSDESPAQVIHDIFQENHLAGFTSSYLDAINKLKSSKNIPDSLMEILQAFTLKLEGLFTMKSETYDLLYLDPSMFHELKEGITGKISGGSNLLDCVIAIFMDVCHNYSFPFHIPSRNPNVQAYVAKRVLVKEITEVVNLHFHPGSSPVTLEQLVEKDMARSGSWLNNKVDYKEEIAIEVEEDVLEKLVLEIVSEMDIRHHTLTLV